LCAGLAAADRIDHSEKHRSPTRNTPQTARISRHGREGISYPFGREGISYPFAEVRLVADVHGGESCSRQRKPGKRRDLDIGAQKESPVQRGRISCAQTCSRQESKSPAPRRSCRSGSSVSL